MLTSIKSRYNNSKITHPAVHDAAKVIWSIAVTASATIVLVDAAEKLADKIDTEE